MIKATTRYPHSATNLIKAYEHSNPLCWWGSEQILSHISEAELWIAKRRNLSKKWSRSSCCDLIHSNTLAHPTFGKLASRNQSLVSKDKCKITKCIIFVTRWEGGELNIFNRILHSIFLIKNWVISFINLEKYQYVMVKWEKQVAKGYTQEAVGCRVQCAGGLDSYVWGVWSLIRYLASPRFIFLISRMGMKIKIIISIS
jgi:hypothetical protein